MKVRAAIVDLSESTSGGTFRVDEAAGIIRGVKVLGLVSANGRTYDRAGVGRAIKLYEGKVVNANHPAKAGDRTPVERRFGWLEGVRQDDKGDLYADLHYLKNHPLTATIVEAAQRRPQLFGLSHNARGKERRTARGVVIESIEAVNSVDLVADPATVSGLFEGRMRTVKEILTEALKGNARGQTWLKEAEGDPPMDAAMASPMPEEPPAGDSDEQIKAAFRQMVVAAFDDDSLDAKATLARIKDILNSYEKLQGSPASSGGESEGGGETPATESRLREELAVRDLVEECGLSFKDGASRRAFIKSLLLLESAERKVLIEERRGQANGAGRVVSRGRTLAGGATNLTEGKIPTDPKALAKLLKS